jgi:hypothetical protein
MSTWYYYDTKGQKQGPITGGQLKGLAKTGQITPGTMVETEEGKTVPASKIKGLTFAEAAPPQASPPPPPNPFATAPPVAANPFATTPPMTKPLASVVPPAHQAASQSVSAPAVEKSGGSSWKVTLIGIVLILVVGFIGLAIIGSTSDSDERPANEEGRPVQAGQQKKATITVSAEKLAEEYTENEVAADGRYRDKIFIVAGKIKTIGKAFMRNEQSVTLDPALKNEHGFPVLCDVECRFPRRNESALASLQTGQTVRIEGKGDGKAGFLIRLKDCSIAQQANEVEHSAQTELQQANRTRDFVKDSVASVPLSETFQNRAYRFSFRYPKGWGKAATGNQVIGPSDAGGTPNMNIVVTERDDSLFDPNAFADLQDNLQKGYEVAGFRNVKFKDFGLRKFAGKNCIYCNIQVSTKEGVNLEMLQFMFFHGGNTLIVTCTDGQRNFDKKRPVFDSMLSSFSFN